MNLSGNLQNGTVIWTDHQMGGKGQHGNIWLSEHGKNLLFTLYLTPDALVVTEQYLLNLVSSLAIHQVLSAALPSCKVEIKWPNDMYVNDNKIAGILIETVISNGKLKQVYCGIGLNVNQAYFDLPNASSIYMLTKQASNREQILENILLAFEDYYSLMGDRSDQLICAYEKQLRWMDEPRRYKTKEGELEGIITSIDDQGKLLLRCGSTIKHFDVKEIEFLY